MVFWENTLITCNGRSVYTLQQDSRSHNQQKKGTVVTAAALPSGMFVYLAVPGTTAQPLSSADW